MAVIYNMEPFEVMKIVYGGKSDGIPEEEFERNKQERGIEVPQSVKNFLVNYGYLSVNRQSAIKMIHPNIMTRWQYKDEDGTVIPLVAVGRAGDFHAAVPEGNVPDPALFLIKTKGGPAEIILSHYTIFELVKCNLFDVLSQMKEAISVNHADEAVELLKKHGADPNEIEKAASKSRKYLFNFNDESRTFILADFSEGDLSRFVFVSAKNIFGESEF